MNKIRIATNDMALTVKMSDEQANVWFGATSCGATVLRTGRGNIEQA